MAPCEELFHDQNDLRIFQRVLALFRGECRVDNLLTLPFFGRIGSSNSKALWHNNNQAAKRKPQPTYKLQTIKRKRSSKQLPNSK